MWKRDRTRPAKKRRDCVTCQGSGKFIDVQHYRDKVTGKRGQDRVKVRCPTCKGRGYR